MVLDKWMRRLIKAGRTRPYLRRLLVMLAAPLYGMLLLGDRVKDGVYRGLQSAARRLRAGAEKAKAAWSNGKRMLKRRLSTIRRGIPAQGAGIGLRITALALMLALIIGVFPVGVWAAEPASGCTHVHDTDCGYTQGQEAAACDKGCTELDGAGQIVHSPQCSYRLALAGTDCRHICDATCGAMATENAEQAAQLGQTDCTCGVQLDADGDSTHLERAVHSTPLRRCLSARFAAGLMRVNPVPSQLPRLLISALPSEELVAQWSDQQRQEHGIYAQLEGCLSGL